MSLPEYGAYKDTGISWIEQLPAHWNSLRIKTLFELMKRPPLDEDGVVTAFRDGEVTLRSNRRTDGFTNSLQEIGYQGVRRGDLVIHAMDAFAGAIGVSDSDGKSTPVYSVCKPRQGLSDSKYYGRLLRHMALSGFIESLAKGIRERSTEFRWAEAGNVYLPVPPIAEQTAIAAFLDRETAKIDALITEQEKLIVLLAEKRRAVISHAVAKGISPKARMKDSGITWLGEVPAHWTVKRMRNVAELNPSKSELLGWSRDTEVSFLPMEAIGEDGSLNLERRRPLSDVETGYTYFRDGDVTIAKITPCFENGKGALMAGLHGGVGFGTTELIVVRPKSGEVIGAHLDWIFRSSIFRGVGEGSMYGAGGQKRVPDDFVRDFAWAFPPVEEQIAIANFLNIETAKLTDLMEKAELGIALLKERRSALIAAAVTGQFDVRGATPQAAIESPEAIAA